MEFVNWYVRRGRIGRRVFWLHYVLPLSVLNLLAFLADLSGGDTNLPELLAGRATVVELGTISTVVSWATLVPMLSGHAARLHDQGRSAWWLLLNLLPPFGQLALLGLCGFVPGQPVANRYGPPAGQLPPPAPDQPYAPGPADRAPDYPPSDWR